MSASYNDQTAWLLQSNCIDSSARPSLDTMYITVFAPTGAFVCPRSHNLGIGLRFHGCSAPSNTYHTPRLGFKFRDWFGGSWSHCTWEHILHATFRVLNFRDWFGVSCLYCTLQSTLETTFRVFIHLGRLPSHFRSRGKRRSLAVFDQLRPFQGLCGNIMAVLVWEMPSTSDSVWPESFQNNLQNEAQWYWTTVFQSF